MAKKNWPATVSQVANKLSLPKEMAEPASKQATLPQWFSTSAFGGIFAHGIILQHRL